MTTRLKTARRTRAKAKRICAWSCKKPAPRAWSERISDLLARKYRFNVPGTRANLNWTRRIQRSIAKLRSSREERKRMQLIRELLKKTGRVAESALPAVTSPNG